MRLIRHHVGVLVDKKKKKTKSRQYKEIYALLTMKYVKPEKDRFRVQYGLSQSYAVRFTGFSEVSYRILTLDIPEIKPVETAHMWGSATRYGA